MSVCLGVYIFDICCLCSINNNNKKGNTLMTSLFIYELKTQTLSENESFCLSEKQVNYQTSIHYMSAELFTLWTHLTK